jgi:hypothetical protein
MLRPMRAGPSPIPLLSTDQGAEGFRMPIRVAFFGNCQAQTLGRVYRDYIAPELDQSVVLLDAQYEHRPQQDVARLLSQVDIVILQQFDFKSRITADVLKPGARRITFPHVTGRSATSITRRTIYLPQDTPDPTRMSLGIVFLTG